MSSQRNSKPVAVSLLAMSFMLFGLWVAVRHSSAAPQRHTQGLFTDTETPTPEVTTPTPTPAKTSTLAVPTYIPPIAIPIYPLPPANAPTITPVDTPEWSTTPPHP